MYDDEQAWDAVVDVLRTPGTRLAAIAETGHYTDLPAGLQEFTDQGLPGRSLIQLMNPADLPTMVDAWDLAHAAGSGSCFVRFRELDDEATVSLTFLDMRKRFGVFLVLCVPSRHAIGPAVTTVPTPPMAPPRFARVVKNEFAVFLDVDEATTQMLGWSRAEMVGRRSLEFVHPDDQDLAVSTWMEMLGNQGIGRRIRLRHLRKDGSYAWFELTNYNQLADHDAPSVRCEIVDISAEMAAHEALRAREQLLQRLAAALPVGVVQLSADGSIAYQNSHLATLLGQPVTSADEIVQALVTKDRERVHTALREVLDEREQVEDRVRLALLPGRVCSLVMRRLDDDAGVTTGAVLLLTDITAEHVARQELHRKVTVDPLTGALNRAGTDAALKNACDGASLGVGLLFIDVDHFKQVNDQHGHAAGDGVLTEIVRQLKENCRPGDVIGRLGGDEFVVVCADVSPEGAAAAHLRVQAGLAATPVLVDGFAVSEVSSTVGFAWAAAGDATPSHLLVAADAAMYAAKGQAALSV